MLGKLIKHDIKSTSKVMVPICLGLVILTLLGSILLSTHLMQREELIPLSLTVFFTYVFTLVAISTGTIIYLIVHFYRNMFSAQGYLTFTLPASGWSIFNAKIFVGFLWILLTSVMIVASGLALAGSALGFENLPGLASEILDAEILMDTESAYSISTSLLEILGYTPLQFILLILTTFLVSCFYSVATGYGSAVIGQLYAKHKIVGTVLVYIGIYLVTQILTVLIVLLICFRSIMKLIAAPPMETMEFSVFLDVMHSVYHPMFPAMIILQAAIGIICYAASVLILKKKINLD